MWPGCASPLVFLRKLPVDPCPALRSWHMRVEVKLAGSAEASAAAVERKKNVRVVYRILNGRFPAWEPGLYYFCGLDIFFLDFGGGERRQPTRQRPGKDSCPSSSERRALAVLNQRWIKGWKTILSHSSLRTFTSVTLRETETLNT